MLDVVLLHAYPLDGRMWDGQLDAWPKLARVHPIHLPGFGPGSDAPLPASIDDMAAAVHLYVREKGLQRFVLGGLSMGGYVALAYWRRYGGEGRVAGMVLANTRALPDDEAGRTGRDAAIEAIRSRGADGVVDRLLPRLLPGGEENRLAGQVRAIAREQRTEALEVAMRCMRDRPDSSSILGSIAVPTLVIAGELDPISPPAEMKAMADRISGATFAAIPECGHLSNLEQPAAFDAAVRSFLVAIPAQDGALQPR